MKTTGRLSLLLAVCFAAALGVAPLRAQDKPDGGEKPAAKPDEPPKPPEAQFTGQIVDFLKHELDLTLEQTDKVKGIMEDAMKDAMKLMMKRMGEEEPDPEQGKKDQEAMRDKIISQIRDILDDAQKKELDSLVKDFEQRAGKFERGNNQPGGDAALWLEGEHPSRDSFLTHAEAALILSQEEHKAIFHQIEKVVDARIALREFGRARRKDLSQAAHAGARNSEIQERFHEIRHKEAELQAVLDRAQSELRDLITVDQEARLVAIGIMD